MKRFVAIALSSCWLGQAAAPPAPPPAQAPASAATQATSAAIADPTIVGVVHRGPPEVTFGCAVFEAGGGCRDISHWRIVVNSKDYAADAWSDALKEELAKWPKAGSGATEISDLKAGVLLLSRGPTAPWVFVARVEAVAHDAGIHRICACESAMPPTKVDQILIDVSNDRHADDHRKYGDTDVTASESLLPVVRNACKVARARGTEPLIRVRVYGACSWSTVVRTVAECREAGASAIDVATKTTD